MPPKKKSKKSAANPARGFATTSVSSKAKVEAEVLDTHNIQAPPVDLQTGASAIQVNGHIEKQASDQDTDLSKLTPEELEARLLEGELQALVEKFGAKVKKDVARTVSKLSTERRLYRGQVEVLSVSRWITEEVLDNLQDSLRDARSYAKSEDQPDLPGHDELSARLWALRLCLVELGIPKELALETLTHLVSHRGLLQRAQESETKDGLWGLNLALDWIGLSQDENLLPKFDSTRVTKSNHRKELAELDDSVIQNHVSVSQSGSGTATPVTNAADKASSPPESPVLKSSSSSTEESESSADDDELNPRERLERYVQLKSRIYGLQPELVTDQVASKRGAKAKNNENLKPRDTRCANLLKRVKALESDILFDKETAHEAWVQKRIELLQESAQRKKLGLDITTPRSESSSEQEHPDNFQAAENTDVVDNVADFFSSLPQETINEKGSSITNTTGTDGKPMLIRDFGKWTGVNPRRILEETCRSRDSGVKLTYQSISQTSFAVRYLVKIQWSKLHEPFFDETDLPGFVISDFQRATIVQMDSVASLDKNQAEAFVSVAAAFHLFSASLKEEKAFMKLPSVWRDLWSEFADLKSERLDSLDRADLKEVQDILERHLQEEEQKEETKPRSTLNPMAAEFAMKDLPVRPHSHRLDPSSATALWHAKSSTPYFQNMLHFRQQLPMWNFREQLLESIEHNQIIIVCGETGCGKSTQTPAYILEHELSQGRDCKIYCTEPRRISAISLARRVSEELGERKHDVGTSRSLVGYAIRLESQITSTTRLIYATTGIVMRMLENPGGLEDITHIILDEVHERTIDSDFLLIILRRLVLTRPDLKIILMSATVNADLFSKYLGGAPVLNVPGRTFPVEVKYLEDAVEAVSQITNLQTISVSPADDYGAEDQDTEDGTNSATSNELAEYSNATRRFLSQFNEFRINFNLIVKLLEAVASQPEYLPYSKAILVFLPGLAEIRKINDILAGHHMFSRGWQVFPLHSTIATEAQEAAFELPPPGIRKIVLATNIAETGVTIPDITCVIDTGKHREMRFDERRQLSRLIECFISKANAKQRRGRAGRVQDGLCFHLFSKSRHDNVLADQQTPEMLRLSLQDLSLRVKICKLGGIEEVLQQALDAPNPKNIRRAVDSLVEVKALTAGEELTLLGRQLAKLPLDVYLGKLILFSSIFQCLDAGLTIAAILTSKSPFSANFDNRNQADLARLSFRKGDSDLLTVYNAYCSWRKVCQTNPTGEQQFCRKNFLVPQTLVNIEDLKGQLAGILLESNFIKLETGQSLFSRATGGPYPRKFVELPATASVNNGNELIVNAVVTWSFYPKLLSREGKGYRNVSTNQTVSLHPASINRGNTDPPRYLSYYSIMQSSSKFYNALETSAAEDFAVALICGDADFKTYSGIMTIDGNRLRFGMSDWKTMMVMKGFRNEMKEIISQNLKSPGKGIEARQKIWFDACRDIFARQNEIRKQIMR